MSDPVEIESCTVDIDQWIEKAKADPEAYLERQVTEIFLAALGMTTPFAHEIFLKGGILMGVVYESPRQTGDVDLTAISAPTSETVDALKAALSEALPRAAVRLGYPDILCAVQSSRFMPSEQMFEKAQGPALSLRIGYARRGAARRSAGGEVSRRALADNPRRRYQFSRTGERDPAHPAWRDRRNFPRLFAHRSDRRKAARASPAGGPQSESPAGHIGHRFSTGLFHARR